MAAGAQVEDGRPPRPGSCPGPPSSVPKVLHHDRHIPAGPRRWALGPTWISQRLAAPEATTCFGHPPGPRVGARRAVHLGGVPARRPTRPGGWAQATGGRLGGRRRRCEIQVALRPSAVAPAGGRSWVETFGTETVDPGQDPGPRVGPPSFDPCAPLPSSETLTCAGPIYRPQPARLRPLSAATRRNSAGSTPPGWKDFKRENSGL